MKTRLMFVALAATASLVACGGEDPSTPTAGSQTQEAANHKAMLDYARCMRQHGVDMPDPQFSPGRATQKVNGADPDTMRAADKACATYRARIKAPEMSDSERAEFKQNALANARCMRTHGVPNFPDPTFEQDGGAQIHLDRSVNPQSARFKRAADACEDTMKGPSTTDAEDGGQ